MIKFKGRLSFRQYLPAKPIKWGVKVWALAESDTGYLRKFQVYCGREEGQERGLAHHVVLDLMGELQNTHINLYMDNFYTSAHCSVNYRSEGSTFAAQCVATERACLRDFYPRADSCRNMSMLWHTKMNFLSVHGWTQGQCLCCPTFIIQQRWDKSTGGRDSSNNREFKCQKCLPTIRKTWRGLIWWTRWLAITCLTTIPGNGGEESSTISWL